MKFKVRKKNLEEKMEFIGMSEADKKMHLKNFSGVLNRFSGMQTYTEDKINYLYRLKLQDEEHKINLFRIKYNNLKKVYSN